MYNCQKINNINVSTASADKHFLFLQGKMYQRIDFTNIHRLANLTFQEDIESKHYFATHITGTGCIDFATKNRKAKSKMLP